MGKCLVTRLQGVVENDNLPILDSLRIKLKGGVNVKLQMDCVGAVPIHSLDGTINYTFNPGNNAYPSGTPTGDTILVIGNKYNIKTLEGFRTNGTVYGCRECLEDLSVIKYCKNITAINMNFMGGDIADIADIIPNVTTLTLGKTDVDGADYIKGDIAVLKNIKLQSLQGVLDQTDITGDLSTASPTVNYVFLSRNRGRKMTWKGTRNNSYPIITMLSSGFNDGRIDFGNDLDNMLINQSQCSTDGTHTNKTIDVVGNKTNASDEAVSTLKEKGFQIIVNGVIL